MLRDERYIEMMDYGGEGVEVLTQTHLVTTQPFSRDEKLLFLLSITTHPTTFFVMHQLCTGSRPLSGTFFETLLKPIFSLFQKYVGLKQTH